MERKTFDIHLLTKHSHAVERLMAEQSSVISTFVLCFVVCVEEAF